MAEIVECLADTSFEQLVPTRLLRGGEFISWFRVSQLAPPKGGAFLFAQVVEFQAVAQIGPRRFVVSC